jgi:hypothetical protein
MTTIIDIKVLHQHEYTFTQMPKLNLKMADNVVVYHDGAIWKIIPLEICLTYSIIYDEDTSDNGTKRNISIVVCPISLMSTILEGIFEFSEYDETKMLLTESSNKSIIPIDIGYKIDKNDIIRINKRFEVKIMTFRDVIKFMPDFYQLELLDNSKITLPIDKYYSDDLDFNGNKINSLIHPKTLVYVLYKDNGIDIVMGYDSEKSVPSGYNLKKSKFVKYITDNMEDLMKYNTYMMPSLWYIAKQNYPDANIVCLYSI